MDYLWFSVLGLNLAPQKGEVKDAEKVACKALSKITLIFVKK